MPPLSLMIKPVSGQCTMRCRYCFYEDVAANRDQADKGKMSIETLENLVRRAMAYAEGYVSFAFQGGEPTLAGLDFFQELIRLEKKYRKTGLKVGNSIQTNGYKINDELLKFLVEEDFLIGISLDGTKNIHDRLRVDAKGRETYLEVLKTVKRLKELGGEFNILTVVNKYVANNGAECFKQLSEYKYLQFVPCIDPFDGEASDYSLNPEEYGKFLKDTFDLYYSSFKKGKPVSVRNFDNYIGILLGREPENCGMCGRCGSYFLVEANGDVYPCDFYVLDQWCMGNINNSSFFRLEATGKGESFRKLSYHISAECMDCRWYKLCRGGCRRDREPFENGLPGLNKWCSSYKTLFEFSYPRMCEIAKALRDGKNKVNA